MALVTISAAYGALGAEVGQAVATALDVPFVDRAIPLEVAERLAVPLADAESRDAVQPGFLERLLGTFMTIGGLYGGESVEVAKIPDDPAFRVATEEIIRRYAASGSSVILGRAGMLVLADHPNVLRVRLTGPLEARIAQAAQAYGLTREQARDQERDNDGPRAAWIRRFYGRDVTDPSLYDLVVDSTRFRIEHCVALIVDAARAV